MAPSLTLVNFDRPRQTSASSTPKKRTVDPRESGLNTGVGALQGCNRGSRGAMSSRRRTDVRIATRPGPLGVPTVVSPPGKPNPHPVDRLYRRTDRDAGMGAAKSIFQIGGAGAVGTGSIRGMPQLLTLAEQDVQIWPFSADGWPRVVEIYPRALTGPVRKSSWTERHAYLRTRFPDQPHRSPRASGRVGGRLRCRRVRPHDGRARRPVPRADSGLRPRLRNRRKDLAARVEAIEPPLASALRETSITALPATQLLEMIVTRI